MIVDFVASEGSLRQRVRDRHAVGQDASEADLSVLEQQLKSGEPLTANEQRLTVAYDADVVVEDPRRLIRGEPLSIDCTITR